MEAFSSFKMTIFYSKVTMQCCAYDSYWIYYDTVSITYLLHPGVHGERDSEVN